MTNEEDFDERLRKVHEPLQELYDIRWDVKAIMNEDIDEMVSVYTRKYRTMQNSMIKIVRAIDANDEDTRIVFGYSPEEDDKFQQDINDVTEKLLKFAQRYIRT